MSSPVLREGIKFHGHLGPYLVLGLLAGRLALKRLRAKKYFGIEIKVWGATKKPKSCLIDGLQLSTGATYGKGNIQKFAGPIVSIEARNCENNKKVIIKLKDIITEELKVSATHKDSEILAKKLYREKYGAFRIRYI
ncbi:MAG: formylmethanofuran dehydrogenase subunit E family protein [Candidatus Omnitrophota bacterium]